MTGMGQQYRDGVFVSLEGLSGVGKTTVAEHLALLLGGEFVPLTADFDGAKKIMTKPEDVNARLLLFASAMLWSSVRIQDRLRRGISVVVDGYVDRTIAYHRGMGATVSIDFGLALRMPDCAVMLVCDESVRRRRLNQRDRPRTLWDDIELANIDRIKEGYESSDFGRVDTTDRLANEVAEHVLAICKRSLC